MKALSLACVRRDPADLRRAVACGMVYLRLPTSFLPSEDQGNCSSPCSSPPGATQERTLAVMEQVEGFILKQPEVQKHGHRAGLQFSGQGRTPLAFIR